MEFLFALSHVCIVRCSGKKDEGKRFGAPFPPKSEVEEGGKGKEIAKAEMEPAIESQKERGGETSYIRQKQKIY